MIKLISRLAFLMFTLTITVNLHASFELTPGISQKVTAILVSGQNIYAGIENGGVRLSNNNGNSWNDITNNLEQITVKRLSAEGNNIFVATPLGVYKTTNDGASWQHMNNGLVSGVNCITVFGGDVYAGNDAGQIYKSSNSGDTWALLWSNFAGSIKDILFLNNNIFVGCSKVYVSTNGGANWSYENNIPGTVNILHANGSTIRVGTNGVYKNTTPTGGWISEQPWGNNTFGVAVTGSNILHGCVIGIFLSTDNGVTWQEPPLLWMTSIYSMAQNNDYVFAGSTNGVYRKSTASFTGISVISSSIPDKFSLYQNYPNPFNPSTNIKFDIPESSNIVLSVYNQLGESVGELVNQKLDAGTYEYNFNTTGLSSGIYYYKLTAEDYSDTRKMILIK